MTRPANGGSDHSGRIECETAVRRLWDFLDGRLPVVGHGEVEAHLVVCAGCRPHFEFARAIQRALAASAPPRAAAVADARLRERVHDALRRLATDARDAEQA
jgi:anti-sigma factor RsiW